MRFSKTVAGFVEDILTLVWAVVESGDGVEKFGGLDTRYINDLMLACYLAWSLFPDPDSHLNTELQASSLLRVTTEGKIKKESLRGVSTSAREEGRSDGGLGSGFSEPT